MASFKRILAVVDPAMQRSPAVRRAAELARLSKSELDLFMPVYDRHIEAAENLVEPEVADRARAHFIDERTHWLTEWSRELAGDGLQVGHAVQWAHNAYAAVISRVLEKDPDLVVIDLKRDAFLHKWSMVQTSDWRLARLCPAPLMLVQVDAPLVPKRVAATVDPRHTAGQPANLDARVVETAKKMAALLSTDLELVHVFPYTGAEIQYKPLLNTVARRIYSEHRAAFDAFADDQSVPEARRFLLHGDPAKSIIEHAEASGIGLLVMGSQYRSGFDRLLLGSTAESLVAQAGCDLLLIRPEGFTEQIKRDGAYRRLLGDCSVEPRA